MSSSLPTLKDQTLALLIENRGKYISGAAMAERLAVSRTAVWKAIEQLKKDGYSLSACTNRGYMLSENTDILSEALVRSFLTTDLTLHCYKSVDSTNSLARELAEAGAPEGTVVIAEQQTAGKGRLGRSFFSPPGTGIYLSILLRPHMPAEKALSITTTAAIAAASAIEEVTGKAAGIKWVNDIIVNGKKVCGILTEASVSCETGTLSYAVVGIGINALEPEGGFPEDIRSVAGAAAADTDAIPLLRCRLTAAVLNRFMDHYHYPDALSLINEYRTRCTVIGKNVNILSGGALRDSGTVEGIDDDYSLLLRHSDGSLARISSGEVSLRQA